MNIQVITTNEEARYFATFGPIYQLSSPAIPLVSFAFESLRIQAHR